MNSAQLSLLPKFGDVEDKDYAIFSAGFDAWQTQVSQYATLMRYSATIKAVSQSWQQLEALSKAVADDQTYQNLLKVDLVTSSLNMTFRNMVFGARLAFESARYEAEFRKSKEHTDIDSEKLRSAQLSKQTEQAALIERLELRESLLQLEKEYTSEEAAQRSVYCQRAQQFNDIKAVITPQKVWHGRDEASADEAIQDSRNRRYVTATRTWQVGSWLTSYVLTFCEAEGAEA